MVSRGAVIRLLSSKCGIDFDIDPQDNLHFIGIFDPKQSLGDQPTYQVKEITKDELQRVKSKTEILHQWEVYVDILENRFSPLLRGEFEKKQLPT